MSALADDEALVAIGAAACIDVWMGGDRSWRTREGDGPSQEFMAGADWEMVVALTRAILREIAPEGSKLLGPNRIQIPQSAEEAKAMWLIGERWFRDRPEDLPQPSQP